MSPHSPVAYRALDFLVKAGFAHKIEALNAYISCTHNGKKHAPAFLICRLCNAVAETLPENPEVLILDAATQGPDHPGAASFYRQVDAVRQNTGCAILMVNHDLHVVIAASDRLLSVNGHICCEGTPEIVVSAPE